MLVLDPAANCQGLAGNGRLAIADVKFAGHSIDALLPKHARHNLVQQNGDNTAVGQASPTLMMTLGGEVADILVVFKVEVSQVEAVGIVRAAGEAPTVVAQS